MSSYPPPPPAGDFFSSLGISATNASLVKSSVATLAAFCNALRTTLVGSMIPSLTISQYLPSRALNPKCASSFSSTFAATILPSSPALSQICLIGDLQARSTRLKPTNSSSLRSLGLQAFAGAEQCHPAAGENAFLDSRPGRVHGIFDAGFLLLHFAFRRAADIDFGDSARKLGDPLAQFFLVVVAGALGQLVLNQPTRPLMASFLPAPSMIVVLSLSILTFLARPRSVSLTFSSWMPRSSKIGLAAGQDGDVLEHGLAAIAVAGGLDRART